MTHQLHLKLNPYAPISATDLATIVATHDLLQAWNNLNENALKAEGNPASTQLINNIQSTAALIAQTEKVVSSQNFELMRALNLYDKTLSATDIAKGFVGGMGDKLTDIAKQAIAFTEPSDMNLQRAQTRTHALLSKPQKTADAVSYLWHHTNVIPEAFQAELSEARQHLAQSMVGEHAGVTIGAELGAAAASIFINSINPTNKAKVITNSAESSAEKSMNWHDYTHLIGGGLHPPPLKPMRDFSDDMHFVKPLTQYDQSRVIYEPNLSHKIIASNLPEYGMTYLIKTLDNREKYGSGTELFLSAIKKFHTNGVDITHIRSTWNEGALGTNWQQFMDARLAGETIEQAAKHTFGGKMAEKLGLTSVDTSKVDSAIETADHTLKNNYTTLYPVFNRPDWGSDPAWSDYANDWVLSQGRAALTVSPKTNANIPTKATPSIPEKLMQQVEQLPAKQQEVVLKQLQENLVSTNREPVNIIKNTGDPDIEP